jgi:hypothetical protein
VLALLCWAAFGCIHAPVQGDYEIESFMRYHVTNMDNNNNRYVDDFDITDPNYQVDITAANPSLVNKDNLETLVSSFTPQTSISSKQSAPGSVHVLFKTPDPFFNGGQGLIDENTNITTTRNPWGNQNMGSQFVTPSIDYDDLHNFRIAFERMNGYSYMQSRSVQIERVLRFSPKRPDQQVIHDEITQIWEVSYGARFYQLDDFYNVSASGGILGRVAFDTIVDNQHAGPHLGVLWNVSQGPWSAGLSGLIQGGMGETDSFQSGVVGEDLNPGAVNSPLFVQPHTVNDSEEDQFGSVYGEIRAQLSRTFSDKLSLRLGCSGYYFGDIKYASKSINWYIPDLGLADNSADETLVTTAFVSLDFQR